MSKNGNTKTEDKKEETKQVVLIDKGFSLEPKNLNEAMQYAELIAKSNLVPTDFRGKAGDILIAVQMGMEVGLKPLQALQNIAVINGRPTLWGDAVLAIVRASGTLEFFEESWDEKAQAATCKAKRKGDTNHTIRTFSMVDAATAGLAKKAGTWTNYPKRMCQMRARAFALRDGWADVLRGFSVAEEVLDYDVVPAAPNGDGSPENPYAPKKVEAEVVQTQTEAKPQEEKKPEGIPEEPAEVQTVEIAVQIVRKKTVKGEAGGTVIEYTVYGKNGQLYLTTDLKLATVAHKAISGGEFVEIVYLETPKGNQVTGIQLIGDPTGA